jgi:hypothetical protein
MTDDGSTTRSPPRNNPQSVVQPKRARGVKIVMGVAAGVLALLALAVWGLFEAFGS